VVGRILLLVLLLAPCVACSSDGSTTDQLNSAENRNKDTEFRRRLRDAWDDFQAKDDGSGDWPYFHNEYVRREYRDSRDNLDEIKEVLIDNSESVEVQVLAARLTQCLSLDEYLSLLDFATARMNSGAIRPEVMEALIVPGVDWGTLISLSFRDERVLRELTETRNSNAASGRLRESIDSVLSGAQASYVQAHVEMGENLPRLRCESGDESSVPTR